MEEWHPWLRRVPRGLSDDLAAILRKMLAFDPARRYQDTDKLAHDLEYFIYQDGYGPTIQTLEQYLRRHFQYLYATDQAQLDASLGREITLLKSFPSV